MLGLSALRGSRHSGLSLNVRSASKILDFLGDDCFWQVRKNSSTASSFKDYEGPLSVYLAKVEARELHEDAHQRQLVNKLEKLHQQLATYRPRRRDQETFWFQRLGFGKKEKEIPPLKGLYLYGSVGCGKTMLMDMFYETCSVGKKQRVHFHKFMLDIHKRIHEMKRSQPKHVPVNVRKSQSFDAITPIAAEITEESWLLCFDEFQVTDIADAMILRHLFTKLFENGVVVVATSNRQPDDLYKNGLQRCNFVPFIGVLKNFCDVHCLDSGLDYRRMTSLPAEDQIYFVSSTGVGEKEVNKVLDDLQTSQNAIIKPRTLKILGRDLLLPVTCGRVLDSHFNALCKDALGAVDYLRICEEFDVVIIRHIPIMTLENKAVARRFITLIDTFYDNKVKIVCLADAEPKDLFAIGALSQRDHHANMNLMDDLGIQANSDIAKSSIFTGEEELFAFERTISRLTEMQTEEYWKLDREVVAEPGRLVKKTKVQDRQTSIS